MGKVGPLGRPEFGESQVAVLTGRRYFTNYNSPGALLKVIVFGHFTDHQLG
jgi:hypothetical protein